MDRLKAMATFVRIVEAGSLSAAAAMSNQSAASVVRSLASLEKHLGVRLLNRNTRRLALTAEGSEFLVWSRRMLAEFDEVEHNFDARRHRPGGLLRITAPVEFGRRYVAPLISAFLASNPAIQIELTLLDRMVDLLHEGMDLAIRIGHLPDSTLVATTVGRTRLVTCASPGFLGESGTIVDPAALRKIACIAFALQGNLWQFLREGVAITEEISARLTTNQAEVASQACVNGLGVARLLHYQVATELKDGRLVRLLSAFDPDDVPIQMVYPHSRLMSPRIRLFIDWAVPRLAAQLPNPA